MIGTIVNTLTVIAGSAAGLFLRGGIKQRFSDTIMNGLGLCVVVIGIISAIKTQDTLCAIVSVIVGALIGEGLNIDARLNSAGNWLNSRIKGDSLFVQGFVTASLVYCVGSMAIVGSLESGLKGEHSTLFAKSLLDGVSAVIFASTLGPGVLFSAIPVLLYQGAITLSAGAIAPLLSAEMISEMSAVGGVLIIGIGTNMVGATKIRVGNLLPAIFIPLIYLPLVGFLASLW